MKHNKLKSVKQNMVETLELPKDLMYGDSIVTITGRREVLIAADVRERSERRSPFVFRNRQSGTWRSAPLFVSPDVQTATGRGEVSF